MQTVDFVVIGAGIAGASVGYELAAHGKVVVVEREATAGYHTTGRSAALFTEAYEKGVVRHLTSASREFLTSPPEGFTDSPLLSPMPVMFIGREDQLQAVNTMYEDVVGSGFPAELLDADQTADAYPIAKPGYAHGGLLEPSAKEIDVHSLHQGFLAGIRNRGGQVLLGAGVHAMARPGPVWIVKAGKEVLEAPVVVNAAGAWVDKVATLAGARPIGIQPMRRTAFTFPAPADIDASTLPFVTDIDGEFYLKPEGVQFLGSPEEETPMEPHDVRHEEVDVAVAIERIQAATTLTIRTVRSAWAGLRSFAPDRKPVVGEDPERLGFFWLAGQGGFGIMTAPAMARAATGLIVENTVPGDLKGVTAEELSPARLRDTDSNG